MNNKKTFDSTKIAQAMISEAEIFKTSSEAERASKARRNLHETQALLGRLEVKAIPARREELTAGGCFKRVRRILEGREELN